MFYRVLADVVAAVHVAWVLAVVLGLVLFLAGSALGWKWVRNRWVRGLHLAMIVLVILRVVVWSADCPLTTWERELRAMGEQENYEGSPVGWFLHMIIHPPRDWVPMWVYLPLYSVFGLLVLATFWFVPVDWRPERRDRSDTLCEPHSLA
jgi:hypothetical protein